MKWPKGKKKNGSGKKKKAGSQQPTPTKSAAADQRSQVSTPGGSAGGSLGLGTLRLGTLRADSSSAPMCTPTPTSRRQSISDLLGPDTDGEGEDLSTVTASPALRNIISNRKSLSGSFDTKRGKGDSITTYTSEEKAVFACHLNAHLVGDPFLTHLMPLDPGGADLFDSFKDGVLMCRIVCLAIPGSIADTNINTRTDDEPLSLYKANENLNVALEAAENHGLQVVNIGATDIIQGRPASILGLTWQLIRIHLLAQINLKGCPDLIHLMEEGESKEAFFELPVEEMLLRWFNHHLRWGGSERRVANFGDDLADGRCYVTLIKELNDKFKGEEVDPTQEEDAKRARFRRACLVISGAEGIGLAPLIRANHITGKAHLYNIAFVAQLLNRRPRIHRESLHLDASVAMQAWFRMVSVMRRTNPVLEERRRSAQTLTRACRRWMTARNRLRAATALQALWRGGEGRAIAANRRFLAEKRLADQAEAKAARQAAKRKREAAALQREKEAAAARSMQALARGVATRQAVSEALESRGLPLLLAEQRRRGLHGSNLKGSKMMQGISPRTSAASSMRMSEDSPAGEGGQDHSFGGGSIAPAHDGAEPHGSTSWFDRVFSGISFGMPDRGNKNPKRTAAAAAMVIQRWQRRVAAARVETARARQEVAKRRWAVDKLHFAYANRWRFEVAARRERRQKWEEEARKQIGDKGGRGLRGLWADITSLASSDDFFSFKGWLARRQARQLQQKAMEDADADCCDVAGEHVLASEIDAWKLPNQVFGSTGVGEAQEQRARALCRLKDDAAWSSPEKALSPVKVFAMVSVLLTVAFEGVLPNAAAIGV
ncbi:unnamed protein product [Ectocarpus sp. 4 AP-2014]